MTSPRLSVVITTTSFDEMLEQALDSVLRDLPSHSEVIVVFDGSPADYLPPQETPAVKYVRTEGGQGASVANNLGIEISSGEMVGRLDGDDISSPGRFSRQLDYLRDNPDCVAVCSNGHILHTQGLTRRLYHQHALSDVNESLLHSNTVIHSSLMTRRSALASAGPYDVRMRRMQDYDLILRLALLGRIGYLDVPLVSYRVHQGQSNRVPSAFIATMLRLSKRRRALASHLGQPVARQALRDCFYAAAQFLRYSGLRRVGYLRQTEPSTRYATLKSRRR